MCFKPKVSTPAPAAPTVEPAPLTEEPKAVDFGGSDEDTNGTDTGRKTLKVERNATTKAMSRAGVNYS